MNAGEGEYSRSLAGWTGLLVLALASLVLPGQVKAAGVVESTSDSITPAVQFGSASNRAKVPTLRRSLTSSFLPATQFAFAYSHPLVTEQLFNSEHAGMTGKISLPGERQFRSELEFDLVLQGEVRSLVPEAVGVSLTVAVGPGWMSEEWTWRDGVTLKRTCFQPDAGSAVGLRFLVRNRTAHALSGVRIMARLKNPEMVGNGATSSTKPMDDIIADPRNEILYVHDQKMYEESWMAFAWGPQGGFMSGGDYGDDRHGHPTRTLLDVIVGMETPACDLFPGQNQESFFWSVWGVEQDQVLRDMARLRQSSGFTHWEQSTQTVYTQGIQMDSRDPYLTFLFYNCKAWARWMNRRDILGNQFIFSPQEAEPVVPEQLQAGGVGFLALGETRAFRQQLESWMDQKYEVSDAIPMLLAFAMYYQWTHDHRWLVDNQIRVEEMLETVLDMDRNGDGLPEPQDMGLLGDAYDPTLSMGKLKVKNPTLYIQRAAASLGALRQGAWLLGQLGNENRVNAARFIAMAEVGTKTLERIFWDPQLGSQGFYTVTARRVDAPASPGHRQVGVLEVIKHRVSTAEKQHCVWVDMWGSRGWWTPELALRSIPADDSDYRGERVRNRGSVTLGRTHEFFQWGLMQPEIASDVMERVLRYARYRAQDPRFMGGLAESSNLAGVVDFPRLNWVEFVIRALAGVDIGPEGLRVYVPGYKQDLGIRVRQMVYRGTQVDVEVLGQGPHGQIWINGQAWEEGKCLTEAMLSQKIVKIRICREP